MFFFILLSGKNLAGLTHELHYTFTRGPGRTAPGPLNPRTTQPGQLNPRQEANQMLLTKLNASGRIHMVPASLNDRFVIRFCVCNERAIDRDILIAYEIIKQTASIILCMFL